VCSSDLFRVLANPVQITQILVNLIANAADALADTPAPSIFARAYPDQHRLCLSIQDNGPGIPPENLEKIWNPLFTSKPMGQGTGLGLAICQEIAQAHGGTLRVASQPGQGATFTLCLPNEADYAKLVSDRQGSASPASASGTPAANN
jgi:C4-dicarboxylate-specific signal transduction histidine kinase